MPLLNNLSTKTLFECSIRIVLDRHFYHLLNINYPNSRNLNLKLNIHVLDMITSKKSDLNALINVVHFLSG